MHLRPHYSNDERKRWMELLARGNPDRLRALYRELSPRPNYELVDRHEAPVESRAPIGFPLRSSSNNRLTRCVVRLSSGVTGMACLPGRRRRHAEIAAVFDALLKEPERYDELIGTVLDTMAYDVASDLESSCKSQRSDRRA